MRGMDHPGAQMRASDRERRATVRALRGQMSDGRLSELTFVRRLDMALQARRQNELDALVADLPVRRHWRRRLADLLAAPVERLIPALLRLTTGQRSAREVVQLSLPPIPGQYVIGRSDEVDMCVDHISVSRRHAVLAYLDGEWVLADLGSRNGTWVNGWRLPGPAPIQVGDLVELGSRRFVVVDRPRLQILDS
jgi:FHA domain/Domain of unknown function (DUF1707)